MMSSFVPDGSLYPDRPPPPSLAGLEDQCDFLSRLCAAWDFGVLPDMDAVREIRKPGWREAVESCELLTSPTYHLLRKWHGLPELPYLGQRIPHIVNDPQLRHV